MHFFFTIISDVGRTRRERVHIPRAHSAILYIYIYICFIYWEYTHSQPASPDGKRQVQLWLLFVILFSRYSARTHISNIYVGNASHVASGSDDFLCVLSICRRSIKVMDRRLDVALSPCRRPANVRKKESTDETVHRVRALKKLLHKCKLRALVMCYTCPTPPARHHHSPPGAANMIESDAQ